MKRRLSETFVWPNLALIEAAAQPTISQVEAAALSRRAQEPFQPGASNAGHAQQIVRADILGAESMHCLVVGAPGAGKTALLRYLAYDKAKNKDYFPIYLALRTLSYGAGEPWLNLISVAFRRSIAQMSNLTAEDVQALSHHVVDAATRGRVALFLDGLDEMEGEARDRLCQLVLDFLSSSMAHNSIVLSTRPDATVVARFKSMSKYELLPFNRQQTRELLEKQLVDPAVAAKLIQQLVAVPALQALAKNPYLAVLFAESAALKDDSQAPPPTLLACYGDAIEYMLKHTLYKADARLTLELLAYRIIVADESAQSLRPHDFTVQQVQDVAKSQIEDVERAQVVTEAILASALVTRTGADLFAFTHLSLAEYLAACGIMRQARPLELICRKVSDSALSQQEVLPIALGLVDESDSACRRLEALPDAIDFTVLRIRARALRYASELSLPHVERVADDLGQMISDEEVCFADTLVRVAADLAGSIDEFAAIVVSRVAVCLQSQDVEVRRRVALALGAICSPRAIDQLSRALRDPERGIREEAARALGNIGDPSCVPVLQHAYLHGEEVMVFQEAVEALVKIGGPQVVTTLLSILNDTAIFKNLRWPVARALGELGDHSAYDALVNALADEAGSVREHAAQALGALGDLHASPALCQLLTDAEVGVRRAAAEALGRLRAGNAAGYLLNALRDSHPAVCGAAAEALMQIDRSSLATALGEIIRDQYSSWRGGAAHWLAQVTGKEALSLLLLLAKDPDSETRQGAAYGLMNIGEAEASEGLLSLLQDRAPDVRWIAADGLGRRRYSPAVPALIQCLESDDSDFVRCGAAAALGNIGDKQAFAVLTRALERGGGAAYYSASALGRLGATEAIPALVAMCKRVPADDSLRSWPIDAIARIGGAAAVQSLVEMLQTADVRGRRLLVWAISTFADPSAMFGLLLGAADADQIVRVYAREGLRALPRPVLEAGLRQGLAHTDPRVRREAARLLPFYADEASYKILKKLALTDVDPQVMLVASEALKAYRRRCESLSTLDFLQIL